MLGYNSEGVADKNRLAAFKHFVKIWKRQNDETVKYCNGIYSYRTKRGKVKSFIVGNKNYFSVKVNTFYFKEIPFTKVDIEPLRYEEKNGNYFLLYKEKSLYCIYKQSLGSSVMAGFFHKKDALEYFNELLSKV